MKKIKNMMMSKKGDNSPSAASRMVAGRPCAENLLQSRSIRSYGPPLDVGKQEGRGIGGRVPACSRPSLEECVGLIGYEASGQDNDQLRNEVAPPPKGAPQSTSRDVAAMFIDPEISNMDRNRDDADDYLSGCSLVGDKDLANVAGGSSDQIDQGGDVVNLLESDDDVSFVSYTYAEMESSTNFGASPSNSVEGSSKKRKRLGSSPYANKDRERLIYRSKTGN